MIMDLSRRFGKVKNIEVGEFVKSGSCSRSPRSMGDLLMAWINFCSSKFSLM